MGVLSIAVDEPLHIKLLWPEWKRELERFSNRQSSSNRQPTVDCRRPSELGEWPIVLEQI